MFSFQSEYPLASDDEERQQLRVLEDRLRYQLDYSYHGIPFVKNYRDLPLSDRSAAGYDMRANELRVLLAANMLGQQLSDVVHFGNPVEQALAGVTKVRQWMRPLVPFERVVRPDLPDPKYPRSFQDYLRVFQVFRPPKIYEHWLSIDPKSTQPDSGITDERFACQRVAGTNPVLLEKATPQQVDGFQLSEQRVKKALERESTFRGAQPTLEQLTKEGRLYVQDMDILRDLPCESREIGGPRGRWLWAPKALFFRVSDYDGSARPTSLMPLALQMRSETAAPILVPGDPAWEHAKLAFQACDSTHHGIVMHNSQCHLMAERLVVATRRALPPAHPVRVLLEPHFVGTLRVVNEGTRALVQPDGFTPKLQSTSLAGTIELLHRGFEIDWEQFSILRSHPIDSDLELEYPYRDDRRDLFQVIRAFVSDYVGLYYPDDDFVQRDKRFEAWRAELSEAGIHGWRFLDGTAALTRDDIVDAIADIIDRVCILHTAINYSVFDFMGFAPNMPGACYADLPENDPSAATQAYLLGMLPPIDNARLQVMDTFFVQGMLLTRLGAYPSNCFEDPRVASLASAFRADLANLELAIGTKNLTRKARYDILLPSRIGNSILV